MFASTPCAASTLANVAVAIMPTRWWGHVHKCSEASVVLDMTCTVFMSFRASCLSAKIRNLEAVRLCQFIIHGALYGLATAKTTGLHTAKPFSMTFYSSHKDTENGMFPVGALSQTTLVIRPFGYLQVGRQCLDYFACSDQPKFPV